MSADQGQGPSTVASETYVHQVAVSEAAVDELGHVSNLAFIRWVLDAARAHSVKVGWDLPQYRQFGAVFVVRRHEIEYLKPAFVDDVVELHTWIDRWTAATSVRHTTVLRPADQTTLVKAKTVWALMSTETGWPQRIPAQLRQAFAPTD